MRYNNRPTSYLSDVVDDLRNAGGILKLIYTSSVQRAKRERTSLPIALVNNLIDFYNNGLDSLLVPVLAYDGVVVYEPRGEVKFPTEFLMGDKNHGRPKSGKQKAAELKEKRGLKKKQQGDGGSNRQNRMRLVPGKGWVEDNPFKSY